MGIARFFIWLKSQFPEHISELKRGQTEIMSAKGVDNFMIDLNGVFHGSAQKIYEYGNHKPQVSLLRKKIVKKSNGIKTQILLFEDICKTIEKLFNVVQPKQRLILCIDGPAPQSKQNQQRSRRYRRTIEVDKSGEETSFDTSQITPGTKFMDFLSKYIDWYIKKRISEDEKWQNIQVIFSNEKSPGEGEAKAIRYVRSFGDENETYCLHGLDADLIMLSLGTHVNKFYILRDDIYNPANEYLCLDIGAIHEKLGEKLKWDPSKYDEDYKYDHKYVINDFIFMCFLVGNDFLPHLPSIEIMEGGMEVLVDVYKDVCKEYGHLTKKTESGDIILNKKTLGVFIGTISLHEKSLFENKLKKKDNFFPDLMLEKHAKRIVDEHKIGKESVSYDLNFEQYREEYYNTNFEQKDIKSICHDYIEGMQWVLSYYTKGVPNWNWYFPHHYAPFASDIAQFAESYIQPVYKQSTPVLPFHQLLSVLPPSSANLLPPPICDLFTDKKSPLKKYYPEEFNIDLSGKKNDWEGVVILPMVNYDDVKSAYESLINKVEKNELKRNILGKSFVYFYTEDEGFSFPSYYGNIENCKARVEMFDL
jgi:5'-3' exonuclease